ncbi:hypothetical protein [Roseateles sp.]|uniref:hypothetical protein n=1 Tax=Roseateles sp. TaxID=1971397 RepID=UPI0025E9157C|nr:hypothetical protein [Roseateles sp.]MBV8036626.1 hypothetical protein [Roseateles sp.]
MQSFFLIAKPLVQDSTMMKLHELLDWAGIAHKPKGLYKREATHVTARRAETRVSCAGASRRGAASGSVWLLIPVVLTTTCAGSN